MSCLGAGLMRRRILEGLGGISRWGEDRSNLHLA